MLPIPHKAVSYVRLILWFTLSLGVLSCDETAAPEFHTPLVIRGVIDADSGSDSTRPRGDVDVQGRSDTPTEGFFATVDFGNDGEFAIAVPEGEFSITISFDGAGSFFVDADGTASEVRTWLSITEESPLPDLYVPFGTLSLTIEEERGSPWRFFLENHHVQYFRSFGGLTPDEPFVIPYLPLAPLNILMESAHGERVTAQIFEGAEPADSLYVRDTALKSFRLSVPEPAVVRCRIEGPSLDWNVREAEVLLDTPYIRSRYEGPVYDGLEIPVHVFTPEPTGARVNLDAGWLRLPFGLPQFDYYLPSLEEELVINAQFAALEFVVADALLDVGEFRLLLHAADYPGRTEPVYMDAFAMKGATSALIPVPAGRWRIEVDPDFDTKFPDQWVDAAITRSASRVYEFVTGETTRLDWTPWPGGRLRGQISRRPSEQETLVLVEGDEESSYRTVSVPVTEDGSFDIDALEHGAYRIAFVSATADPRLQYYPGGVGFTEAQVFGFEDVLMFDDLYFEIREGAPVWTGGPISWDQ